jgi:hypothetical protein
MSGAAQDRRAVPRADGHNHGSGRMTRSGARPPALGYKRGVTLLEQAAEIVPGDVSGGPNTSHTVAIESLSALLQAVSPAASEVDYRDAVLDQNLLGKATQGSRWRSYRYLRELYLLRPNSLLFRALRDLWAAEPEALPLLAGLCALARDAVFRASGGAILDRVPGEIMRSSDLAVAIGVTFPESYGDASLAKLGRNTFSSWEQTGHLEALRPGTKRRVRVQCGPADVAYALLLGHLEGVRGEKLFSTFWARTLDRSVEDLIELASDASRRHMLELRAAGGVIEVGFRELMRPLDF